MTKWPCASCGRVWVPTPPPPAFKVPVKPNHVQQDGLEGQIDTTKCLVFWWKTFPCQMKGFYGATFAVKVKHLYFSVLSTCFAPRWASATKVGFAILDRNLLICVYTDTYVILIRMFNCPAFYFCCIFKFILEWNIKPYHNPVSSFTFLRLSYHPFFLSLVLFWVKH